MPTPAPTPSKLRLRRPNAAGNWAVRFPPMKGSHTPIGILVSNPAGPVVTVHDVLVVDVGVASGRSNMELALRGTDDAAAELARANEPRIRFVQVRKL